jgi:hypothetical protein
VYHIYNGRYPGAKRKKRQKVIRQEHLDEKKDAMIATTTMIHGEKKESGESLIPVVIETHSNTGSKARSYKAPHILRLMVHQVYFITMAQHQGAKYIVQRQPPRGQGLKAPRQQIKKRNRHGGWAWANMAFTRPSLGVMREAEKGG